ncbi:MAG: ADP-ribosylglycohydrolase family protein [Deltaproteobacteria bacterium]|nr:ADP-ribosylglycohydrolase family protein [Candidatus Zymogenaceae bacterium]
MSASMNDQPRDIRDVFAGIALGTMVGDAFGAQVEGWDPESIQREYGLLSAPIGGVYTDDTQMMIGLMEALVECAERGPNFSAAMLQESAAQKFLSNFDPSRGYGRRILGVMRRIESGLPAHMVGTDSWGNGAAMRIAPVGMFFYDNDQLLIDMAVHTAEITHIHPAGVAGAVAQAVAVGRAVRHAVEGDTLSVDSLVGDAARAAGEFTEDAVSEISRIQGLSAGDLDGAIQEIVSTFSRDVSALGAVPAALAAFVLVHRMEGGFPDVVMAAVNSGGDTDTIGAMAGAVAGAYWGVDSIPKQWLAVMENGEKGREYIRELALRLAELKHA